MNYLLTHLFGKGWPWFNKTMLALFDVCLFDVEGLFNYDAFNSVSCELVLPHTHPLVRCCSQWHIVLYLMCCLLVRVGEFLQQNCPSAGVGGGLWCLLLQELLVQQLLLSLETGFVFFSAAGNRDSTFSAASVELQASVDLVICWASVPSVTWCPLQRRWHYQANLRLMLWRVNYRKRAKMQEKKRSVSKEKERKG